MSEEGGKHRVEQQELRRNLRVPLIVEKLACGDGHKTFFGYAKNISCGGLFIATVKPREPGEQFDIELTLPPDRFVVRGRCEVIWKRLFAGGGKPEPGMGLRFLDLPAPVAARLEAWVRGQAGRLPP